MSSISAATCPVAERGVRGVVLALLDADPSQCDGDELASLAARSLRVRGWLDALDAGIAARAADLAAAGTPIDAATVLDGGGRRRRRDAEAAAARGEMCASMPALGAALADGTVTAGHVDAVVAAAAQLDADGKARLAESQEWMVDAAASMTPEQFDRTCKRVAHDLCADDGLSRQERMRRERSVRRWVDRYSGMHKTLLSLDPLADATTWTAINAAVSAARTQDQRDDDRTWDQLHADVVVDLLTRGRSDTGGDRRIPEVSVLIDHRTLVDGVHDETLCETTDGVSLPVDTLRRLSCEADIVPVVLGGAGEVLDVGRACRVATRAQRRALRAMYRTCAHPQCSVSFDTCRIHHVVYWFHGGTSDLANLLPLCETHHHLVHEGGWQLTLRPDRRTTWRTADGTVHYDGIGPDRLDRSPTTPMSMAANRCRHVRSAAPETPPSAADVATQLRHALVDITSRAPP